MQGEIVEIPVGERSMGAYLARPDGPGPFPGVVFGIEGFGVTDHIKDVADRLAAEGYVVVVPDQYHRFSRFATAGYTDYQAARDLMHQVSDPEVLEDLGAALDYVRSLPEVAGKSVGLVGFRIGGRWAYLTACERPDVKAVVSFYGNLTSADFTGTPGPLPLDRTERLQAPFLLLAGDSGAPLTAEELATVEERLRGAGKSIETQTYPGVNRGFMSDPDPFYNKEAAEDAWSRLTAFLAKHLA